MDTLAVDAGLGDDTIDASNLAGGIVQLTVDAGVGTNRVVGSGGNDTAHFPGTVMNDDATLASAKSHALFTDDHSRTDLVGVETVEYDPFAGADVFNVSDLRTPAVTQVNADLATAPGTDTPDGATDTVRVIGTNKGDDIGGAPDAPGSWHVSGLGTGLRVTANDTGVDGNDTFRWSPGDGNDVVEGGAGSDELRYDGANVSEYIGLYRVVTHVQVHRGVANELVEIGGVEKVSVNTYAETDTVAVNDLTGREVNIVNIDANGAPTGDGVNNTIAAFGTDRADNFNVKTTGTGATISGLGARINVASGEYNGLFHLFGEAGNDRFNATKLADTTALLWIEGGAGNDTLTGSPGSDVLVGDAEGGSGTDTATDCEIAVSIP